MKNVISLGAGRQSSYMLLRAIAGDFGDIPDFAIFADTGCEPSYVYDYIEWLKKEVAPFEIVTVTAGDLLQDTIEYINGKRNRVAQLPLRTMSGLLPRQCTYDYKIRPMRKYLRPLGNIRMWIGISLDEMERMKESNVKYIQHYYPLVHHRITTAQILQYFKDNNIKEPKRSSCVICPFHSLNYWKALKENAPDDFNKAVEFDDAIRDYPKLNNQTYLSKQLKPLSKFDFNENQLQLFPELIEECDGICGL